MWKKEAKINAKVYDVETTENKKDRLVILKAGSGEE